MGEDRFLADKVNVENVEKYLFALDFVFEAIVLSLSLSLSLSCLRTRV